MSALQRFIEHAQQICGEKQVWTDELRILSYGTDASFYQYLPKVVVDAQSESQVQKLLKVANKDGVAVTFRAAGTSLSGQTISDSVIIQLQRENWKKVQVLAEENATGASGWRSKPDPEKIQATNWPRPGFD